MDYRGFVWLYYINNIFDVAFNYAQCVNTGDLCGFIIYFNINLLFIK